MTNIQNQQTSNAFVKEIIKIGKKDKQATLKILSDLELLETLVLSGEKIRAEHNLEVKPIITNKGKLMQLSSGQYRIWYKLRDDGTLQYVKVFKKEKNSTPKRFIGSIPKLLQKAVSAEEVKVKELLGSMKTKNKEDTLSK